MNIKKHIPNAITCGNLLCGCLGILVTSWYRFDYAFFFILLAAFLDFFDGFFARILKVTSPIGKDLDSLADVVTFGVLPGFIMFRLISLSILKLDIHFAQEIYSTFNVGELTLDRLQEMGISKFSYLLLPLFAFLIPIFSAIRLAKFNNDTRQSHSFIGLPTPANGVFIASFAYIMITYFNEGTNTELLKILANPYFLIGLTILMSYLLIAEIPLFALKFKNFGWNDNKIRFVFLIISILLLIVFHFIAIPFIIFLYITLSAINNSINKKNITV
jgi:CDP-diacylglycerol--serine O-phosphatidyltransferase